MQLAHKIYDNLPLADEIIRNLVALQASDGDIILQSLEMWILELQELVSLRWRHNGHDSVSNHQPHHCLLNRLFRRRSKKTSTLRVAGLCVGNSTRTREFPAQMASNAENVSIWWRHYGYG